jgi:hypothetical protein
MVSDRSKSSSNVSTRSSSRLSSKPVHIEPEVVKPVKADGKATKPDLKVKFKVTHSKGLRTKSNAKQFLAESEGKPSVFARKVVRELGLSTKYQYAILIHDTDKGWVKLSSLNQLTSKCKLRIYKVEPRQPDPKPQLKPQPTIKQQPAAKPQAPPQSQPATQVQMREEQLYYQNMIATYNYIQYQQMLFACQQFGYPIYY